MVFFFFFKTKGNIHVVLLNICKEIMHIFIFVQVNTHILLL